VLAADQGLRRLIEGNKRFVAGKARFPTVFKETLAALAKGQQPYATIVGGVDSRVRRNSETRSGRRVITIARLNRRFLECRGSKTREAQGNSS
jgi:carbonic anhydrase